jgi:hypothetical protein
VPTDTPFEQRIRSLYAVSVPTELDRRIETAMTTVPLHRSGRSRPRMLAALAVAAIFAITAAGPAIEWFEGWNGPFDRLWEISTPVDQAVTTDGYRVTVHRAYADRLGVRLAMTVEDLDERWSDLYVDTAKATDADGRAYEGWNSPSRRPVDGSSATWLRFPVPADALGDDLRLRVTVTRLLVRSPDPIPPDLDPARMWTTVGGEWTVELDVPPFTLGESVSPSANDSASGVTIAVEELGVVPSGTLVRLAVEGLPEMPSGSTDGWYPDTSVEHDGVRLSDDPFPSGLFGPEGDVTLELTPVVDDLAGHWRITIFTFNSFDPVRERFGEIRGPWVVEFDVVETADRSPAESGR